MDTLHLDLTLGLRSFPLELALEVERETVALVGPSGSGKTTVLRAAAGLLRPDRGRITLDGETWFDAAQHIDVPPEQRSVGYVFQDYALFPHLTVRRNVEFGGRRRTDELLRRFGIADFGAARPAVLSGGERQRVALARALAREPRVLLLDEPLAALDAHTRFRVREELQELLSELALPVLVVTHDFEDALALAGRVGVLRDGRLLQVGTPAELAAAPADPFVAALTGGNLLPGSAHRHADGLTEVVLDVGGRVYSTEPANGRVGVLVHPWEVAVARVQPNDSALNHLEGTVTALVPQGNRVRARIGPLIAELTTASAERLGLSPGSNAVASFKATATRLVPLAENRPPAATNRPDARRPLRD
jgi:molybdate transport system ATP-binding protein